jgi:hypothetical protein
MKRIDCAREQDVLDAIAARRWPGRCDPDLREHVASCAICADLVDVVVALTESHDTLWPDVQVPSSANVWWRAQLRAREEAARKAARPITVVQVAASVAALAVLVVVAYVIRPWLPAFTLPLPRLPALNVAMPRIALPEAPASLSDVGMWTWVAVAVVLSWAVIAPLVIYFATSEEER